MIALVIILLPFALLERQLLALTQHWVGSGAPASIAVAIVGLLALDILLPIPSSVVSTAGGAGLGFFPGVIVSTLGMTLCCQLGYLLGRTCGLRMVRRIVVERDLETVSAHFRARGDWALAVRRPIPVLAEASVLFAGVMRLNLRRFGVITLLSNAGISAVYSAAGAVALEAHSFVLAFAGAILAPALVMYFTRTRLFSNDRASQRRG
jgi:uncharacterized membrane protein YdjX (TVP38/TMEM64 family)